MTGSQPHAVNGRLAGRESLPPGQGVPGRGLLLASILVTAINLRAPLTAVGPLLAPISLQFRLSATEAGLLNTLPLLAFAVFSLLVPQLSRWAGTERSLLLAVAVLAAGTAARALPWTAALFAATLVLGAAIAVANTLLPGLVKRHFPGRQSTVTGVYVGTMTFGSAVASGVAVPLARVAPEGWRTALGCWALLALPAAALWFPQLRRQQRARRRRPGHGAGGTALGPGALGMPWRSLIAWQVTAFMGLQSLGFFVMVGWLPSLLRSHGASAQAGGWMLSLYQVVNLLFSVAMPLLIDRFPGQRTIACASGLCCAAGYLGLIAAPDAAALWVVVCGAGTGCCFVLALSFMAFRAQGPGQTAALSAMAQSIGYLTGAVGPVAFGFLRAVSGSWTPPLLMLLADALALAAVGLGAGRPVHLASRKYRTQIPESCPDGACGGAR